MPVATAAPSAARVPSRRRSNAARIVVAIPSTRRGADRAARAQDAELASAVGFGTVPRAAPRPDRTLAAVPAALADPVTCARPAPVRRLLIDPAPIRLTRRGRAAVAGLVLALAAALLLAAWSGAPSAPVRSTPSATTPWVTVRAGDTLWDIAARVAPRRDPRLEIASLQRLNHLGGVQLRPGQLLRTG